MKNEKIYFNIFAYNVEPNGVSGGETILIELFKRISKRFSKVIIFTWKAGADLYRIYGLNNVEYKVSNVHLFRNFYLSFLIRIVYSSWLGLTLKLNNPSKNFLFFSSDFWPDAFCVILLKLRYPSAKFVSNFYLAAPNPFRGFKEKGGLSFPSLNGFAFWLMQKPIYWFTKKYADLIFVTSEPDVDRFPSQRKRGRVMVVKGGVNFEEIKKFNLENKNEKKSYDGVFMGRFHPQKGVLELVSIWKDVVKNKPNARLIMIGDGPLMNKVTQKIKQFRLGKNIILKGLILSPKEKYKIFKQSRIIIHPAVYDSGGMSAAEGMAFGLPAVSFDLLALKSYYPKGMIKIPQGELKKFAETILKLLADKYLYDKTGKEALDLIESEWDWDKKAETVGKKLVSLMN